MIKIDITNVEEKIFFNQELHKYFSDVINKWKFGKMHGMYQLVQDTLIDFLNSANKHKSILESYFKDEIKIEKINKNIVTNDNISIDDAQKYFSDNNQCGCNLVLYRDENNLFITCWR